MFSEENITIAHLVRDGIMCLIFSNSMKHKLQCSSLHKKRSMVVKTNEIKTHQSKEKGSRKESKPLLGLKVNPDQRTS